MGMGFAKSVSWEWEWLDGNGRKRKLFIFPISSPRIADHQTMLMNPCLCIVICRRLLGFTLDVHETLLALILHVYFLKIWFIFSFYNITVPCIVEFTGHLLSDEILLAVREWERGGMGITNGNGKEWE